MKKLILPTIFFIFLLLVNSSNAYAQSSDCWKEYSDIKPICDQAITEQNLLEKCDQASNIFHQCLGVDKNPWKLKSSKPGHLSCKEWKNLSIVGTAQNCVAPVTELFEKKLWCLNSAAEISQVRSHPVDYILDFDPYSCILSEDDVRQFKADLLLTSESSLEVSQKTANGGAQQETPSPFNIFGINPYETWLNIQNLLTLNEMVVATGKQIVPKIVPEESAWDNAMKIFSRNEDSNVTVEIDPSMIAHIDEVLNRTPEMTEEIINQYKAERKALYEGSGESPYRLDILEGEIQIKLPGQNEWSDLKVGDKIPPGSTIFTGMDTTTVLSIRDKGVVEILSFTEVTISEEGLSEPGKTTTEINLRTGEVELNLPSGIFTGSLQVFTTNAVAGVKGTHFWVSYNKENKLSTIGVYKGKVEVKGSGSDEATLVSPKGDQPGVVVVSQKLSSVKLGILVLVIAGTVGGVIWLIKRKFLPKPSKKR